jgi:hypothetical protein
VSLCLLCVILILSLRYRTYVVREKIPKIRVCAAHPYFRVLFCNCVTPEYSQLTNFFEIDIASFDLHIFQLNVKPVADIHALEPVD